MKILNLKQFLAMPEHTLYYKFDNAILTCLAIKCMNADPESIDFYSVTLDDIESTGSADTWDRLEEAVINGTTFKMDFEIMGRDGFLEEDRLYAVFEKSDIEQLIERLKKCL